VGLKKAKFERGNLLGRKRGSAYFFQGRKVRNVEKSNHATGKGGGGAQQKKNQERSQGKREKISDGGWRGRKSSQA